MNPETDYCPLDLFSWVPSWAIAAPPDVPSVNSPLRATRYSGDTIPPAILETRGRPRLTPAPDPRAVRLVEVTAPRRTFYGPDRGEILRRVYGPGVQIDTRDIDRGTFRVMDRTGRGLARVRIESTEDLETNESED